MRVLVVDDDTSLRLTLALLLRARGFDVDQAASAEDALAVLACGRRFDAVVSDVRMGKLSGVELAVRAKRAWPHLRVILMSGFCQAEDLAGADVEGFAEKPPDVDLLVEMLDPSAGGAGRSGPRPVETS